jgi:hypothetical protein
MRSSVSSVGVFTLLFLVSIFSVSANSPTVNSNGVLIIPSGTQKIGDGAYSGHENVVAVVLPESLKEIGEKAFFECENLVNITFNYHGELETIGVHAFSFTSITNVTIPASVITLGNFSFSELTSLTTVQFQPDSQLKTIGKSAFTQTQITEIIIPYNVEIIADQAFQDTDKLKTVLFEHFTYNPPSGNQVPPGKLKTIGNSAFQCSGVEDFTLIPSVSSLGDSAFLGTGYLQTFNFFEGTENGGISDLTSIGKQVFYNSALTKITFPPTITSIGESAFTYGNNPATHLDSLQLYSIEIRFCRA